MPLFHCAFVLGLCGFLPLHPRTYLEAKRNRQEKEKISNENAIATEEKIDT